MVAARSRREEAAASPAPSDVPGNDWTLLEVEPAHEREPAERVTVVVEPAAGDTAAALTAAALEAQSYPSTLVEVIGPGEEREPDGEVVILLGAGAVPEPGLLAAHARWHRAAADVVSVAPVAPVDGRGLDPDAVRSAASQGRLEQLLEGRGSGSPELAVEDFELLLELTGALTERLGGLYCAAALGIVGLRRDTYLEAGGPADPGMPASLRRLDLAQRLACAGTVLAPETSVRAWSVAGDEDVRLLAAATRAALERRTIELDHPGAAALVALEPFRPAASSLRFRRPALVVNVDATGAQAGELLATTDAVLGGRHGDLELRVQVDESHPGRSEIAAALEREPRAAIAASSIEGPCESPFQIVLPAAALPDPRTIGDLHRLLVDEDAGALHVTVPGAPPDETMITAFATPALRRARRVAARTGEDPQHVLGRLFGERWVSGVEVSVRRHGVDEPHVTEHGPLAAATDLRHERTQHLRFRDRVEDLAGRIADRSDAVARQALRARGWRLRAERLERRLRELGDQGRA